MSTRRKFLTLVGAAPAVAKEAASAAMGLSGPIGPISAMVGSNAAAPSGYPISSGDGGSWVKKALERLDSEKGRKEIRQDAKNIARILDPDIAAMRSLSPSVAYRIQIGRVESKLLADRRAYLLDELKEFASRGIL